MGKHIGITKIIKNQALKNYSSTKTPLNSQVLYSIGSEYLV
jgi:hypothetical protein